MWICAKCGTQAQQIEVCSGCGCLMTLPEQVAVVSFALLLHERSYDESPDFIFGPFTTVMEADQWWDAHKKEERFGRIRFYTVTLMENPNDRTT